MSNQSIFTLKIGGFAGQGVKSAGLMLAKVATRSGYYTYDYSEYPSLIRGGHNVMTISFSNEEITSVSRKTDLLIALNQQTLDLHLDEMSDGTGILFNEGNKIDTAIIKNGTNLYPVPFLKVANKELLINTVAVGAAIGILNGDILIFKDLLSEEFGRKGAEIVEINHKAAQDGYDFIKEHYADKIQDKLKPLEKIEQKIIVTGNDAVALGAIAAGLQFMAIYPMTPTSNILHILSPLQEKYGFVYKQPEDEIAAVNMAIGASYAGARSMTATSGGGFCLMAEGYGLAGQTETPLVIINGMRPGPATGLPTWSEQGDLRFILHAHQGDFPRIVLAAGDAKEAFEQTLQAFNLAEKYQTPVVILVDKNICENDQSYLAFDTSRYEINRGKFTTDVKPDYKRYLRDVDGISTRTIPGTGNYFIANSDEHNELGYSDEEGPNRKIQMEKRMKKLEICAKEDMQPPQLFGPENADLTIISWGSNKGSILQAIKQFDNVNYYHVTWMNPFPSEAIRAILEKSKKVVDIEYNYSGQLAGLIREKTGIEIIDKLLKYDGRIFYPEEIVEKINSVLNNKI